ncbi:MAG: hypothetical protein ABJG68_04050 [Crocinitomicaceae bacterium]
MKKIFLLALITGAVATLNSCKKDEIRPTNKLEVRFTNNSDEKIKDFKFQGISIGNIAKNSTTKYYKCDPITMLDGYIYEVASVKSEYGTVESWLLTPGIEHETLNTGKHTIELSVYYGCGIGFGMNLKE